MRATTNDLTVPWVGIDFGTSNSSVARIINGQPLNVREPNMGVSLFPSCVLLAPPEDQAGFQNMTDRILVGYEARNNRARFPNRFREGLKRYLGQEWPLSFGQEEMPVEDAVSAIIREMKDQADRSARRPYTGAVITVPVDYEELRLTRMKAAVHGAGFHEVAMLREPEAAALYHAAIRTDKPENPHELVLVYDFGGGTFDAALVQIEHSSFGGPRCEVIAFDGIADCGGIDVDHKILSWAREQGSPSLRAAFATPTADLSPEAEKYALMMQFAAIDDCRRMKHELSNSRRAKATAEIGLPPETVTLSRDVFDSLLAPIVERTLACCEALVARGEKRWSDIDDIVLVGGSSRMPLIAKMLERFGRRIRSVADPELAVSLGAALYTLAMLATESSSSSRSALRIVNHESGPYRTIQSAIDAASSGDTIHIYPGRYSEALRLDKDVDLVGRAPGSSAAADRSVTVSSGEGPATLMIRSARCRIYGIALRSENLALDLESSVATVENCQLVGRVSAKGGAPTFRANSVIGQMDILGGANAILVSNEVSASQDEHAISVYDTGTAATIEGNLLRGYKVTAVSVAAAAAAIIADNLIEGDRSSAIAVVDARATIRSNKHLDSSTPAADPMSLIGIRVQNPPRLSTSKVFATGSVAKVATVSITVESDNGSGQITGLLIDNRQTR